MRASRTAGVIAGASFVLAITAVILFAISLINGGISSTALSSGIGLVITALLLLTLGIGIERRNKKQD